MKHACGDCFWWIFSICNGEECKEDAAEYCLDQTNENFKPFCDYYLDATNQFHTELKDRFQTLFKLFKAEIDGNPVQLSDSTQKE